MKPIEVRKGLVTEILNTSVDYSLVGSIQKALDTLRLQEQTYSVDYSNIRLDMVPQDYEDGYTLVLVGDRPATNKEVQAWNEEQDRRNGQKEQRERQQFEILKAKYEKENK